jgi:riboflavin kinase/FMN adenylyltransferase
MGKLIYLKNATHNSRTALTVGTFDGVHQGHQILIGKVVEKAREINGRSVVVTFNPHPREVLHGGHNKIKLLTTLEERVEILKKYGIDEMIVIPFDRDFSLLSSNEFIEKIIYEKIGVSHFVIGYDHQFGKNREGTINTVKTLGESLGFEVYMVDAQEVQHITVSSTTVRKALADKGNVEMAASFLGRPYQLTGMVIHGDKKGREIGYPTANIRIDNSRKIIPLKGVYAVTIEFEGILYKGMMNIGYRPTVTDNKEIRIEVNIFDFEQEIYGKQLKVHFYKRIRDEQKFDGISELKKQLGDDKQNCLTALKSVS